MKKLDMITCIIKLNLIMNTDLNIQRKQTEIDYNSLYSKVKFLPGGFVNIYKDRSISSAKTVFIVKKYLAKILNSTSKKIKVGHTGTLDLEARGILPIAFGCATKLVDIIMNSKKSYNFIVRFGYSTDTMDSSGKINGSSSHYPKNSQDILNIIPSFIGNIKQIPPIYSAIKINGKRAYDIAMNNSQSTKFSNIEKEENILSNNDKLQNIFDKNKERKVNIYDLKLNHYDISKKEASFSVECSKGTYIRSLATDIALSLQSLGYVIDLERSIVGCFSQKEAISIGSNHISDGLLSDIRNNLFTIDHILGDIPVVEIDKRKTIDIIHGKKVMLNNIVTNKDNLLCLKTRDFTEVDNITSDRLYGKHNIVAIGKVDNNIFTSNNVFCYLNQ
ncbi:MAG TPA: hypothetical protein QKA14_01975 [Candidatus Megaira endosymbiont of Hartmannula sinica]|nr:hypothetical protein [Candidatus Megaera endosymbiont of Hartmannula sinica]